MMDINAQIAQRLAPQGPVKPGPALTMPSLAERQADIDARRGTRPEPMRMQTAEERQADINARMGNGYTGARYHGEALGPISPFQPAGLIGLDPEQARIDAIRLANGAAGRESEARVAQNNQNILNQMAASRQQAQQSAQASQQRQRYANDPAIAAELDRLTLQPDSVKKYAQINNFRNQLAQQIPEAFNPTGKTNQQAAMAQWNQGAGVRNAERMIARRKAEEQYYRERNAAMARAQAGPGFSLGNLAQAINPFKGVTAIVEGKGSPKDYLDVAKTLYGFF